MVYSLSDLILFHSSVSQTRHLFFFRIPFSSEQEEYRRIDPQHNNYRQYLTQRPFFDPLEKKLQVEDVEIVHYDRVRSANRLVQKNDHMRYGREQH